MFSLICAWINGWVNNREAGDLRRHRAHYDVTVMKYWNINIGMAAMLKHCTLETAHKCWTLRLIWLSRWTITMADCRPIRSRSIEFLSYPGLWLIEQFPPICRQLDHRIELKFGGRTHYAAPQPGCLLVTLHWIPAVWLPLIGGAISAHFPDKLLRGLISNLLEHSYGTHKVRSAEFLPFPGLWLAVSAHFRTNRSADWSQTRSMHPLGYSRHD